MPALPHAGRAFMAPEEKQAISLRNQATALNLRATQLRRSGDADMAVHVETEAATKIAEAERLIEICQIREADAGAWRDGKPLPSFKMSARG